jgi:hypothetical protein
MEKEYLNSFSVNLVCPPSIVSEGIGRTTGVGESGNDVTLTCKRLSRSSGYAGNSTLTNIESFQSGHFVRVFFQQLRDLHQEFPSLRTRNL